MQEEAKFGHARASNALLDLTMRFNFVAGSQAGAPQPVCGLLPLLLALAPLLLQPEAKAALRDLQSWVRMASKRSNGIPRTVEDWERMHMDLHLSGVLSCFAGAPNHGRWRPNSGRSGG